MNFRISKISRVVFGVALLVLSSGYAAPSTWSAGTGSWDVAANWSGTLPLPSDVAFVDNGGTVTAGPAVSGTVYGLYLGNTGTGTLSITGGNVYDAGGILGGLAGASGTAMISSGTWTNTQTLTVGWSGSGALKISGGLVTDVESAIGYQAGSMGAAIVTGGTWSHSSNFYVGYTGSGSLTISKGIVSDSNAYVGYQAGSSGTVAVSGGTWNNSGQLTVGGTGSGVLTITNSGVVTVNNGTGVLTLGNGSTLNLGTGGSAGTLNVQEVVASSAASLNFNHTGDCAAPNFSGMIDVLKKGSGTTTLASGTFNNTARTVTVDYGIFKVNGNLTVSNIVNVGPAGLLCGSGTVTGILNTDGTLQGSLRLSLLTGSGLVSPGDMATPGIMSAATLDATSGLDFAFTFTLANANPLYGNAAASGNSILCATPNAALTSGNTISFYLSEAALGDTFLGGFFSSLSAAELEALIKNADFAYYVQDAGGSIFYNGVRYSALNEALIALSIVDVTGATFASGPTDGSEMKVTVVPEPVTWALFLGGLGLLVLWQRRHRTV